MKILKWLLSLFKKDKSDPVVVKPTEPIPEIPKEEEVENFPSMFGIKKVALIVGHGPKNKDGGADTWNGSNEFEYNSHVVNLLMDKTINKEIKAFYRGSTGIVGVAMDVVAWNPDLSIELHLNSYNGMAKGCEVLCLSGDDKSAKVGRLFADKFTKKFGRVKRGDNGIKWIDSGDRGASSLRALSPIKYSILIEPFFCDNKQEWIEPIHSAKFLADYINEL